MKYVYLVIAAMMLLCLAPMPYGYYMLARFVAMVVFAILAIRYFGSGKMIAAGCLRCWHCCSSRSSRWCWAAGYGMRPM